MEMIVNRGFGASTTNPPPIPGKYVRWPDANLQQTPPAKPPKPLLSLAYPLLRRGGGPASVA